MKRLLLLITICISSLSIGQVPNYVPTNGLVGWWPFNGNANDESGNGNNGAVNGATLTTDRFGEVGNAYQFNAANANNIVMQAVNGSNALSLSYWVFSSITNNGVVAVQSNISNSSQNAFNSFFGVNNNNPSNLITGSHSGGACSSFGNTVMAAIPSTQFLNAWQNITIVYYSSGNVDLYINSQLAASQNGSSYSVCSLNNSLRIGGPWWNNDPCYFQGKIDDIGIWNRALNPCEIADLYNAQSGSLNTSSATSISNCGTYTWNGQIYTQSGQYSIQTTNAAGCDSTVTLNLTITEPTTGSETITECSTYTWAANNQTYIQSGQYTALLTNLAGCDSTVTLNLTITQPTAGSETVIECDSYTWSTNGQTYTQSGQYTTVLTNAAGCDSTVILDLTIAEPSTGSETITECDSYTWNTNGQTYTQSGQYNALLTNAAGCDSTVTLNLTVEVVDITTPPADQTVLVGASAQFTVTTSAVNPTYQWQLDNGTGWTNLSNAGQYSGVNTAELTIANVQLNQNNFLYRCWVNAGNCSATSSVARLSVDDNVGLEELSKNVLQLYPNPASSSITLASDHIINTSYRIIDAQGREVKKGYHEGKSSAINIENLSTGSYTIIFDQQILKEIKFIKE